MEHAETDISGLALSEKNSWPHTYTQTEHSPCTTFSYAYICKTAVLNQSSQYMLIQDVSVRLVQYV